MGASLTVNDTATANKMVRLVDGKLIVQDAPVGLYIVPPKAGTLDWKITGYALPFEMKRSPKFMKPGQSEYQTKTRLEFTITSGGGAGKMFTEMYSFSIGTQATLGKLCRKLEVDLTPDPITHEWDLDRLIGYEGRSYVGHGKDETGAVKLDDNKRPKYAQIVVDTVEPMGKPDQVYSIQIDPKDLEPTRPAESSAPPEDDWV